MIKNLLILLVVFCFSADFLAAAEPAPFAFNQNDRVVFVGDSFFERDLAYNYLETMLPIRFHGKGLTFRNLGWSGDTVWGEARGVFGTQKDGYNALIKAVNEARPNVVFICYGMNESFGGAAGLAHFEEGYNALLDNVLNPAKDAEHVAAPPAQAKDRKDPKDVPVGGTPGARPMPRVVLISPIAFQSAEANPAARMGKQNENLKLYSDAISKIAATRGLKFVDMLTYKFQNPAGEMATMDGLHLTANGFLQSADGVLTGLGVNAMKLNFDDETSGIYTKIVAKKELSPLEKLRALIGEKNLQFFYKWRPQNETYLFLFRKHEQGRNAKEIPEFDPFIAAKEAEISKLADEVAKGMGL